MKPELSAEIDRDILAYVRGMQEGSPVTADAITRFLVNVRQRRVTGDDVVDRLIYLTSSEQLKKHVTWVNGQIEHWTITAKGMDIMDGVLPPQNWRPR